MKELIISICFAEIWATPFLQFDRGQYGVTVASDSSDRSKDKTDQKVIVLYINCIEFEWIYHYV